ncbi:hypothetical protein K0M31_009473 [Melipona bicolor]|uniref:Uncharacterized protein n=1 Tax=Melipona bicolor TaxID=60889 RepID=A0AA40FNT4_9HYME|nr:hypothetical protein K0M31_009473 [Melipona bicolor]
MAIFSEYPTAVTAEIVPANGNSLEASMKPLDIDLPPTLPMSFGTENSTVISAQSGSTALLPCVVHNLGDGMGTEVEKKERKDLWKEVKRDEARQGEARDRRKKEEDELGERFLGLFRLARQVSKVAK